MTHQDILPQEKRLLQAINRLFVIPMATTRTPQFLTTIRDYMEQNKIVEERPKVVYRWRTVQKIVSARHGEMPIDTIERVVKEVLGIDPELCLSERTRKREVVFARQLVHYFARFYTEMSHLEIGELYGDLHHSTVVSSVKKIDDYLDVNHPESYVAAIKKVSSQLSEMLHNKN